MKAIIFLIRKQKGQALVEFALILPLLMLLVFGITEFGRAMYIWNTLNNSARTGARVAVVTPNLIKTNGPLALPNALNSGNNGPVYEAMNKSLYTGIQNKNEVFVNISTTHSPAIPNDSVTVTVRWGDPQNSATGFQSVYSRINVTNTLSGSATMRYE